MSGLNLFIFLEEGLVLFHLPYLHLNLPFPDLFLFLGQCPFPDWWSEWLPFRYYRCYMMMYWHYYVRMLVLIALKRIESFSKNLIVEAFVFFPAKQIADSFTREKFRSAS